MLETGGGIQNRGGYRIGGGGAVAQHADVCWVAGGKSNQCANRCPYIVPN